MGAGTLDVGRKKSPTPMTTVKLEAGLIRKAKAIAGDKGIDTAQYLSDLVRVAIEKDWTKILKKIAEAEGGGE
jgi:hypothetical protein